MPLSRTISTISSCWRDRWPASGCSGGRGGATTARGDEELYNRYRMRIEAEGPIVLSPEESRHVSARRLRVGDALVAFDGRGKLGKARLESASKREAVVCVEEIREQPRGDSGFPRVDAALFLIRTYLRRYAHLRPRRRAAARR